MKLCRSFSEYTSYPSLSSRIDQIYKKKTHYIIPPLGTSNFQNWDRFELQNRLVETTYSSFTGWPVLRTNPSFSFSEKDLFSEQRDVNIDRSLLNFLRRILFRRIFDFRNISLYKTISYKPILCYLNYIAFYSDKIIRIFKIR